MAFSSLNKFISELKKQNEILIIDSEVSVELEITEITDRIMKSDKYNKALLFTNNGTRFPVLINCFGSEKRMSMALNVSDIDSLRIKVEAFLSTFALKHDSFLSKLKMLPILLKVGKWMPKKIKSRGACQDVIMKEADLSRLPILKCWPHDGGCFFTLPCVHTVDPVNKAPNVGMYRMQVLNSKSTGMHWHIHKTGAKHFDAYKKLKKPMPVAVTLGGDPVYTYVSTAPMPENIDEYILAGFLRKKPVKMVKCLTNDLWVPSDVDFVIEGYIDPSENFVLEGPFGDHTGFYSLTDYYPQFHITTITHRKDPVFPATIVGVPPMEDSVIAHVTEKIFLPPIKFVISPEIVDMHFPAWGVAHNIAIISIKKQYKGQTFKVAQAMWGAGQMMFTKMIIIVDEAVDVRNYRQIINLITDNLTDSSQILFTKGVADELDHAVSKKGTGSKIAVDLTHNIFAEKKQVKSKNIDFYYASNDITVDFDSNILKNVKLDFAMVVEPEIEKLTVDKKIWYLLNNIDPLRDVKINETEGALKIIVDGRIKKDANRWPNIVTMDKKIINQIDEKWGNMFNFPVLKSPSMDILHLTKGDNAFLFGDF